MNLTEATKECLKRYINHDEPFGPINAQSIDVAESEINELLFDRHNRLYSELAQNPKIIVGRKGSGKTAYLNSVYLDKRYRFIVPINAADTFTKIIEYISEMLPAAVFPEKTADLWRIIIEISVMRAVLAEDESARSQLKEVKDYLAKIGVDEVGSADEVVWQVVNFIRKNLKGKNIGIVAEALAVGSTTSHEICRKKLYEYLKEWNYRGIVLIDTLDKYNLKTSEVADAVAGLLKCVGSFNAKQHFVDIRLCVPSELYHDFIRISSNPIKDFESEVTLHWHARELVMLASHRLKLYSYLYYPQDYIDIKELDCNHYKSATELLLRFLPKTITNELKFDEEVTAYLVRHTQLTPRHLLLILNSIFKKRKKTDGNIAVSPEHVVHGIRGVEEILTEEIFTSFNALYPNARNVCKRCIPEWPYVFNYSQLHTAFNRVGKSAFGGDDMFDFQRMLIEMGIIGRKTGVTNKYYEALFEYLVPNQLHTSLSEMFCIHPLFLTVFSARYEDCGKTIYPFGSDPTAEDHRAKF